MAIILDLRGRLSHAGIPLVHPTSEHVVLANVFGTLKNFAPDVVLNPWLQRTSGNRVLPSRNWQFSFWERQRRPIGSVEGSTEVDMVLESETSLVFVEVKMGAGAGCGTKTDPERNQLIRNMDIGYCRARQINKAYALLYVTPDVALPDIVSRIQTQVASFPANSSIDEQVIRSCIHWSSWGAIGDVLAESLADDGLSSLERGFVMDVLAYLACKRIWNNTLPQDQSFYDNKLYRSLQSARSQYVPFLAHKGDGYQAWRHNPWTEEKLRLFLVGLRLEYKALLRIIADAGGAAQQHFIMQNLPFFRGKTSASLRALKAHINGGCKQLDCAPLLSEGVGLGDRRIHEINRSLGELRKVVIEVSGEFDIPWHLLN